MEVVENSQLYSDRVCNPCARKIRNLGTIFELIRNTIIGSQSAVTQTLPKLAENLSKRLLDTTPGRSPCRKTVRVNSPESVKASRKSLRFDAIPQPSDQDKNDLLDSNLNIDNLTPGEELRVKVVIVNSSGNVTTRIPRDEESKQLVRQLCNKNWQAATNSIILVNKPREPRPGFDCMTFIHNTCCQICSKKRIFQFQRVDKNRLFIAASADE